MKIKAICMLWVMVLAESCVPGSNFDIASFPCPETPFETISFKELEDLYQDGVIQIQKELTLEGFVISSDIAGNFYNEIYLQDRPNQPTRGLVLMAEQSQSLYYPLGSKVKVNLKGLFLGKSGETLQLGSSFASFGNISVGRLPATKTQEHLVPVCSEEQLLEPTEATMEDLDMIPLNTLIRFNRLEFVESELERSFADFGTETGRTLKDCDQNQIILLTSGYSDFQPEIIPIGSGNITGILSKDGQEYQLLIRSLEDLEFSNERCPEIITEFTSNQVFISELADPDNNTGARFVELYNAANTPLDLNLWTLRRYTNDKTEVSSTIDLTGKIIEAQTTFVISPNTEEFELIYGFIPDMGVSTNSPADSNGDDNLELVDPFGTIIDVFGVVGEDGTGTNHEFEDGRALRNLDVSKANPNYTFSEWTIQNDSGDDGTIKHPQMAPEDYTPGTHN
nr:DUF5689 domain-containing protein [Allomuricauda sp.]